MKQIAAIILFLAMAAPALAQTAPMDGLKDLNSIAGNMVSFSDLDSVLSFLLNLGRTGLFWLINMSRGWINFNLAAPKQISIGEVTVKNPSEVVRQISEQGLGAKEQLTEVQSSTAQRIETARQSIGFVQSVLNSLVSFLDTAEKVMFGILH